MSFPLFSGVVEDIVEVVLNLKQVRFKRQIDTLDNERVSVSVSGQDKFTAGDIGKFLTGFQVLNPDLVICHLDKKTKLTLELTIDKGRGYVPGEENKPVNAPVGTIAIDAIFTPVKNVKYVVENYRVEQKLTMRNL
jgi:DNA-directed RNA polymerase subunit alpha